MARYIVTGGAGFIGKALVEYLQQQGHEPIIASRGRHGHSGVGWIEYDLQKPETIANLTSLYADGVFHLAWSTLPGNAEHIPGEDIRTNVAGSMELFSALMKCGVRTVFVSSGGTIYGLTNEIALSEVHPLNPIGVYGLGKLATEQYADLLRRTKSYDVRIARLSNPYGTNVKKNMIQGAVSVFARQILSGDEICIMGDGSVIRDYIDVISAVKALYVLMLLEVTEPMRNATFNVGSGEGVSLRKVISLLEEVTGVQARVRHIEARPFDVPYNVLDTSKIRQFTNWMPDHDLHSGLISLYRHIRQIED